MDAEEREREKEKEENARRAVMFMMRMLEMRASAMRRTSFLEMLQSARERGVGSAAAH